MAVAGAIGVGAFLLLGPTSAHEREVAGVRVTPRDSLVKEIADAKPGTTLALAAGRYPALVVPPGTPRGVRVVGSKGAVLASITVQPKAGGVSFSGLSIPGGVVLADGGARDVAISHSRISGPGDAVTLGPGTREVRLEDNDITAPHGDGIVFNSQSHRPNAPNATAPATATIEGVTIRGNRLHDINVDAIRPANFARVVVEDNEISGLVETGDHSDVLQVVMGGRDLVFRRNYVHDNTGQGFFIKDGLVDHAVVADNLFVRNKLHGKSPAGFPSAGFSIAVYETTSLELRHNTVWDGDLGVSVGWNVGHAVVEGNLFQDMVVDPGTGDATAHPPIEQSGNLIAGGWNWGAREGDVKGPPHFRGGDYRLVGGARYGAPDSVAARKR
jgi:hypothetical protein